jgi:hypothetical protein
MANSRARGGKTPWKQPDPGKNASGLAIAILRPGYYTPAKLHA